MEIIVAIGSVSWAVISMTWGAIWVILTAMFWLTAVVIIGLFATIMARPELFATRHSPEISAEAIKTALRSGELDGEIARINQRNNSRKSA